MVMEIGWTDVGSRGYILVSCAHSNTMKSIKITHNQNVDAWKRKDASLVYTNISIRGIKFVYNFYPSGIKFLRNFIHCVKIISFP
jgi:hypothetical protein